MSAPALPVRRGPRAGRAPRPLATGRNALLVVGYGIGLALVCIGSYGAGGETTPSDQMGWLAVSILGLLVAGSTNGLWFMDARRRLSRERVRLLGSARPHARYVRFSAEFIEAPPASENPVSHANSTLFHRPGCELVAGRSTTAASRAAHEANGRRACEVCEP